MQKITRINILFIFIILIAREILAVTLIIRKDLLNRELKIFSVILYCCFNRSVSNSDYNATRVDYATYL